LPNDFGYGGKYLAGLQSNSTSGGLVSPERTCSDKRIDVDLYESMVFWFAKEFVKAILALGLILGIIIFLQWINSDD
jgi:hypothetical protein